MKTIHNYRARLSAVWFFLFLVGASGCKKFLQVQPEDKYTEDQVFSNETAIQQALNGIYTSMADDDLYGFQLTQYAVEYFGQRYTITSLGDNMPQRALQKYDYQNAQAANVLAAIWTRAFQTITKTNKFLEKLTMAEEQRVISPANAVLLRGEALAIRANLHFDMLRLFGPVYSIHPETASIPYYTQADAGVQPLLAADKIMEAVLDDFRTAVELLAADPVINNGLSINDSSDFYTRYRNRRINYYAARGLLARAYLYAGQTADAYSTAKSVLEESEKWFPWLPYTSIVNAGQNPDRVFSTEVIFGLDNRNLYNNYLNYFSPDVTYPVRAEDYSLDMIFESNTNDYRYITTWISDAAGMRWFSKYADITDKSKNWRFLQPLFRKSELYYILAETDPDPDQSLSYLNTARFNRGLPDLSPGGDMQDEITKEYRREFYGEGQLFFYYKRKNIEWIPSGQDFYEDIQPGYVPPLPELETLLR